MADGLAADAILLHGKVEGHVVGLVDAVEQGGHGIEVGVTDGEGDVSELEGV
jgi:hypothetical protein